ncbi:MAG TPA: SDR family NAD(P)-dependent oxidoreductase [Steroidobacteraceae bacterium]|nr:SDR family NAD(P)-dependent oxidoreductase [Steroidobacteraceae bacterium]HQX79062.1 SDR family NAD(P)-dependent oxidoreductase [Steroidobacteraceae bacterium]
MPGRLQGKVAFITGAGSGIGLACARLFAREGGHVVIAELMPTLGRAAESEILEAAGQALFVQTDVTDEASIARALEATLLRFGALHVLVNCAGGSVPKDGPVTDIDVSVWDHSLTLDLKGTFLCCRHAIPHLVSSGGGSVVNFSSMVALLGRPVHAYSAAKGGVLSLTRALAASYGPKRVRVNAICPGLVLTERIRARVQGGMLGSSKHADFCTETHPFSIGEPEDIAHIALFLASDESRMIHGATLAADGGMSAY